MIEFLKTLPLTHGFFGNYLYFSLGSFVILLVIVPAILYVGSGKLKPSIIVGCLDSFMLSLFCNVFIVLFFGMAEFEENISPNVMYSLSGNLYEQESVSRISYSMITEVKNGVVIEKPEVGSKTVVEWKKIATVKCPILDSFKECVARLKIIDIANLEKNTTVSFNE